MRSHPLLLVPLADLMKVRSTEAVRIRPCLCPLRLAAKPGTWAPEFPAWAVWPAMQEEEIPLVFEAQQSACPPASVRSSAEPHSIRRILCPPGYLCRIARMQASDHLDHTAKF